MCLDWLLVCIALSGPRSLLALTHSAGRGTASQPASLVCASYVQRPYVPLPVLLPLTPFQSLSLSLAAAAAFDFSLTVALHCICVTLILYFFQLIFL